MNESILDTIKSMLGITDDDDHFDAEVAIDINGALAVLFRLGVGEKHPFAIHGRNETWADFLGSDEADLEIVKSYVHLKTKIVFAPPVSTVAMEAMKNTIFEYEWTINDVCERKRIDSEKAGEYTLSDE